MRALAMTTVLLTLILGCAREKAPDRHESPEAALVAARVGLHNHDLASYLDALSDEEVLLTLKNSISICSMSRNPEARRQLEAYGHRPSIGCDQILQKYGWVEPDARRSKEISRAWSEALERIARPREMCVELEANHRRTGAGSSFVWEWLDGVTVKNVEVHGDTAKAIGSWSGEEKPVVFRRDRSGWRFTPTPELIEAAPRNGGAT